MKIDSSELLKKPLILSYSSAGIGDVDIADPQNRIEVLVGPIKLSQKDRIDLFWGTDKEPAASYTHSNVGDTNGIFSLYVDTHWIEPGTVDVNYVLTPFPSNIPEHSESAKVLVKLTIPGGRDSDPSTPYENEKLQLPVVSPPGPITEPDHVLATVAAYENMSVGDNITLSWHGEFIRKTILSEDEIAKPVILPVSKDIIERAGDSDMIEVRYEVRDLVNNWSRWSLATYVDVEAGQSTLAAPVVPQAPGMELDLDKLNGDPVQVLVLSQPEISDGDEVLLLVERSTAEGMPLETYSASKIVENAGSFIEFLVPNEQFQPITQGRARLKYTLTKPTGDVLRSKSLPVKIIGTAAELALPRVPAAELNNGVLDPNANNVIVEVPPYHFMGDGNDVTLVWMGKSASGANVMHEELKNLNLGDVGKPVNFLIPDEKISALAGGMLEVFYTITTYARTFFKSPVLQLMVGDDSNVSLVPPSVDGVDSDGVLDPASIVLEATVRIAPYSMAEGDKVTIHWDGQGSSGTYSDSTIINSGTIDREIVFRVEKSYVDANIKNNVIVWYEVDRNSQKFLSEQYRFSVGNIVYPVLPAPRIKEATDNLLDPANATDGATVVVDVNAILNEGDLLRFSWEGPKGSDRKEKLIEKEEALKPAEIVFASSLVSINDGQTVDVSYSVTRTSGIVQDSDIVSLRILSAVLELPAPTMDTVGPDGILRPSLIPESGGSVRVSYPDSTAGDLVMVRWMGTVLEDTPAQTIGAEPTLTFNVSKAAILASEGTTATLHYYVQRAGVGRESEKLALTVTSALEFDTSAVVLSGKVYLLPGTPELLPTFPTGTTVKRVATGGKPPYVYHSSDVQIAQVDTEGLVTVRGKGGATITATDAAGESKAYSVSVTGVIHCVGVGSGNLTQVSNAATAIGARIPNIQELIEIYNAYKGRWPMGKGLYWSSTVAKTVLGAKWYYAKDLNTGKDYKYLHVNGALGVAIR